MPVNRPNLTHFLCIPLVNSGSRTQLQTSLRRFTHDVITTPSLGISSNDVKHVGSLHLTLGVMSLNTKEKLESAGSLLHSLDMVELIREASILDTIDATTLDEPVQTAQSLPVPGPDVALREQKNELQSPRLSVSLLDLQAMHAPESTSVLFARPFDSSNRLFKVCCAIRKEFSTANLLERSQGPLLLHATIVNKRTNRKRSNRFDARDVIKSYEGFEWAKDIYLERVSICRMGVEKFFEDDKIMDAVYAEVDYVSLP